MSTLKITTIILYHGEVGLLEERIKEVKSFSQVIVLDDPSEYSRQIKDLAVKQSCMYLAHDLNGDFATHRNFALEKVDTEWTFFLDSDESVTPDLASEISSVLENTSHNSFSIPRRDIFLGKQLSFGETGKISLVRLARTNVAKNGWNRAVHEVWNVPGTVERLKNPILHTPHATISLFLQKLNTYAVLEPGQRQPLSRRKVLFELFFYPSAKFFKAILWQQGWRDGVHGWIHAFCMSYYSLIVRVFCWEVWHAKK